MFDPSVDAAGTYTYTIAPPEDCEEVSSSVTVTVVEAPNAGEDASYEVCFGEDPIDLSTLLGGTPDAGGTWSPALDSGTGVFDPSVDTSGTYTYTVAGGDHCPSATAEIQVTVNPLPIVMNPTINLCDENFNGDYEVDFSNYYSDIISNSSNYSFSFFETPNDAENNINAFTGINNYNLGGVLPIDIYVRVEDNNTGCVNFAQINFDEAPVLDLATPDDIYLCEDVLESGKATFDLTQNENTILSSADSFEYYTSENDLINQTGAIINPENYSSGNATIWVRVSKDGYCDTYTSFSIFVNPLPYSDVLEDQTICAMNDIAVLDAGEGFNSYQWFAEGEVIPGETSSTYETDVPGNYSVLLTQVNDNGPDCSYEQEVHVYLADIPFISNVIYGNGSVQLVGSGGDAPYLFNVNGGEYTYNDTFYLPPGLYTFGIMSNAGCEGEAVELPVISITDTFTPNGDGINDYWSIQGLQYLEDPHVQVYDRYGKVILDQEITEDSVFKWGGKYLGRTLPSTTYWYTIDFKTLGGTPVKINGYLLIKNRNQE